MRFEGDTESIDLEKKRFVHVEKDLISNRQEIEYEEQVKAINSLDNFQSIEDIIAE